MSINPNKNSILTPQRPVPDVRLGYASTGQWEGPWLATSGHSDGSSRTIFPFREVNPCYGGNLDILRRYIPGQECLAWCEFNN